MGIFNESADYHFNRYLDPVTTVEALIESEGMSGTERFNGLTIQEAIDRIEYENCVNYANISKKIALQELGTYASTGKLFVYTEGAMGDFWNTMKAFILKIWDKIKNFFKALWAKITSLFMEKDNWARKYKKEIEKAKTKSYGENFKFEGYGYTLDSMELDGMKADMISLDTLKVNDKTLSAAINTTSNNNASYTKDSTADAGKEYTAIDTTAMNGDSKSAYETFLTSYKNADIDDINEEIRGQIAYIMGIESSDDAIDSDTLRDDLVEKLRGGDDEKDEIKDIPRAIRNAEQALLEGYKKYKKIYDRALKDFNKAIDKSIKALDDVAKHLDTKMKADKITKGMYAGDGADDSAIEDSTTGGAVTKTKQQKADEFNVARGKYAEVIRAYSKALQTASNIATEIIGIWTTEYNQWLSQSQALLIKAISYKKKEYEDYHEDYTIRTTSNTVFDSLGI